MNPTDEQQQAIDLFLTGGSLTIEAGAGTGKTSTLVLLAEAAGRRRGQYVAFNKALVEDGRAKFPATVAANTAHSLAFRAVGRQYQHRLNSGVRMTQAEVARHLDIAPITLTDYAGEEKTLRPGFLAGRVSEAVANFCRSADTHIGTFHFPYIEGLDKVDHAAGDKRSFPNNARVWAELLPYAKAVWADVTSTHGWAPYKHDHYLKQYQLTNPRIEADYILFDEAQDANPVIAAIIDAQLHAQRVYVGDSQQEIYAWTGAVNSLAKVQVDHRTFLSQSFRFGPAIADAANEVLSRIPGADLRLKGLPSIPSRLAPVDAPRAILTRTNAEGLATLLRFQQEGLNPHLLGGSSDMAGFARGADQLITLGQTSYPQLAAFSSWQDVQQYAADDVNGTDLQLLVKIVDSFGAQTILEALEKMPTERAAAITISTAHKAKGRQWSTVRLASDFPVLGEENPTRPVTAADLRLLYVAVTRAEHVLDVESQPKLRPALDD